jgi:hypothetical protein
MCGGSTSCIPALGLQVITAVQSRRVYLADVYRYWMYLARALGTFAEGAVCPSEQQYLTHCNPRHDASNSTPLPSTCCLRRLPSPCCQATRPHAVCLP